jgi:hypothetical protein
MQFKRAIVAAAAGLLVAGALGAVWAASAGAQDAPVQPEPLAPGTYVGPDGVPYSVDPVPPTPPPSLAPEQAALPAPFPNDQTFLLHSKPGSQRTIYLDFNGHTASGTKWSQPPFSYPDPIVASPYDTNGAPASFSQAEIDVIQSVWQRVAEDYSPWDVDVTTQEPSADALNRSSSGDQIFGTRVVVTNLQGLNGSCACGGTAFIGTFAFTSNSAQYQPAWVFAGNPNLQGAKNIAEAASHEIGHNLGLFHDTTTSNKNGYYQPSGLWGAIMGAAYSTPVAQFSKGEYPNAYNQNANNPPQQIPLQDDLAVIAANGLSVRTDDHGSLSTATALGTSPWSKQGVIATASDTDAFGFTASGPGTVHLDADPAPVSPNLDIRVQLFRDNGGGSFTHVVTADPATTKVSSDVASGMDATLDVHVPAGSYIISLDGVGSGTPATGGYSDYASIGQYSLVGSFTPDAGATVPAAPTGVAATPSGTSATVSFTPGSDGGAPVSSFTAKCSSTDGGVTVASTGPASPLGLSGLSAGRHYRCVVRANNAVGAGPYSAYTATFLAGAPGATVPAAPTGVAATPSGTSATVSFTPGSDGGAPVSSFTAKCSSTDGGVTVASTGPASPLGLSGLSAGRHYRCVVRANNAMGAGPYSAYTPMFVAA